MPVAQGWGASNPDHRQPPDWMWLIGLTVGTVLLTEIPYLIAYSQSARGLFFTGMFWSPGDYAQFAAAMREGAASASWLVHNHLTGEPHSPAFMYPLYVALGKLAGLTGIDHGTLYHAAEAGARVGLLLSLYAFCRALAHDHTHARLGFLLAVFAAGIGFWLQVAGTYRCCPGVLGAWPAELNFPEFNTFLALFTAPHLMLGLALLLLAARFALRAWTSPGLAPAALAGAATAGLGLVNPFGLVTLAAWLVAQLGLASLRWRRVPRRACQVLVVVGVTSAPFVAYNALVFSRDPFWGVTYGSQNILSSPPLLGLIAGFGALVLLAAFGLRGFLRSATPERLLVVAALIVSFLLMYAPVPYQRRFGFGIHPLLAIVAAGGLLALWPRLRLWSRTLGGPGRFVPAPAGLGRAAAWLVLGLALLASNLVWYRWVTKAAMTVVEGRWPLFQPRELVLASDWLSGAAGLHDVILADASSGNFIAGRGLGRVFVGHPIATLDFETKARQARAFFAGEGSLTSRLRFLSAHRIRYVLLGPAERRLGGDWLAEADALSTAYSGLGVEIFAVSPGESAKLR